MRKRISILFALVLILGTGFSLWAGGAQETESAGDEASKLTIWHAYAGQADKEEFMKYAMDSFKAKYPDIEIDEMGMEHSSYKVKLNTAMNTGSVPDVFYTLPGSYLGAFVEGGMVESISSDLNGAWGDTIMDSALARVTYGEDVYAVPIDVDATVVWYNKALFAEKGWETPSTAAEFTALCETIKNDGIVPIALGNKDQWPSTFWFQYPMLRLVKTGIVDSFNAGDSSASFSPEGAAAFQFIADIAEAGYFPKGVNGISAGEANMLFLNGQAAMVLNGTWQIGMTADAPDEFELGYFGFPTFAEGKADQTDVIAGVAACFAVSKDTPNRDAAILFLKHMTSKDVAAKYVEIRKTLVTTIGAATEENAGEVLYGISSNVMEGSASLDSFYDTAMPPAAVETYYTVLQGVISGDITAADAAAKLDASMTSGN